MLCGVTWCHVVLRGVMWCYEVLRGVMWYCALSCMRDDKSNGDRTKPNDSGERVSRCHILR